MAKLQKDTRKALTRLRAYSKMASHNRQQGMLVSALLVLALLCWILLLDDLWIPMYKQLIKPLQRRRDKNSMLMDEEKGEQWMWAANARRSLAMKYRDD